MAKKEKSKKISKIKEKTTYLSDEQREVMNFIIIIVGIVALIGVIYGVSKIFIKNAEPESNEEVVAGAIDYDVVSIGTMFNRPIDEYYVAIYNKEDAQAIYYSAIINKYMNKEKSLKVYFCDLNNSLNKKYYVGTNGETNPNAKKITDLALGDLTFIKIKDGKIKKYLETVDEIKKELGL